MEKKCNLYACKLFMIFLCEYIYLYAVKQLIML